MRSVQAGAARLGPGAEKIDHAIAQARDALLSDQHRAGYWCYELEADCTIPAEYILFMHFMDDIEPDVESGIVEYLRRHQGEDGGWPLYHGGEMDLSCSVKAYYALKLAGESPEASHMRRAREAILAAGGAEQSNVFTRITLAVFRQLPWRGVPFIPVEIMLLPRWFPFHLYKVSYWSRTVMVPLFILCSLKATARNPRGVGVRELFCTPPERIRKWFQPRSTLNRVFIWLDRAGRAMEPLIPGFVRRRAIRKAESWFVERLNGENGLGAIFPAMVNACEALDLLGYEPDHPYRVQAREALRKLLVDRDDGIYCQPCVSPVWDTGLACLALQEAGGERVRTPVSRALDWLADRQLREERGDWQVRNPDGRGGGWAFQFNNAYYPDLDDTAVVAWAMHQADDRDRYESAVQAAADWLVTMQSRNDGFAAFDRDNTYYYLNEIPFADHGALLDPPTADVSARCLTLFGMLSREADGRVMERALRYLQAEQEDDGCWFGRWGTNYIYGTWSVLMALERISGGRELPEARRAVAWLKECQRPDGGWGEGNDSYFDPALAGQARQSRAFQTAWAVLGLLAAGDGDSAAVRDGVQFLLDSQDDGGRWREPWFTAPGFPRVFYLKYHGYHQYFPLWALARYRKHLRSTD